jgi:hypothetical protein
MSASAKKRHFTKSAMPGLRRENADLPPCLEQKLATHREGGRVMAYDADAATELKLARLRLKRQRYSERMCSSQTALPAISMIISEWYVDEFGMLTREITARE